MDLGAPVEAERQMHSRELVGAAMCVVPANAVPRAGVERLERVAAGAAVEVSVVVARASMVAAGAAAGAGAAASVAAAAGAAAVAAGAGGGDAGMVFIYPFSLAKEALRRKCRCVEAPEMLLTSHRSGAGAL